MSETGIELVDMCSLQDPERVNFNKMKDSGIRGVYFKSSQYSSSSDPTFNIGVERAKAAGLVCGAYHFAYCGSDPTDQAVFFYKACRGLGEKAGELPPMMDWEFANTGPDGQPLRKSDTVKWLVTAMAAMKTIWYPDNNRLPTIYSFPFFCDERQPYLEQAGESLSQYPLTLAAYPSVLNVPKPWTKVTIHQYVGNGGRVPGVTTDCDRDRFLGTEDEFRLFLGHRDESLVGSGPNLTVIP